MSRYSDFLSTFKARREELLSDPARYPPDSVRIYRSPDHYLVERGRFDRQVFVTYQSLTLPVSAITYLDSVLTVGTLSWTGVHFLEVHSG